MVNSSSLDRWGIPSSRAGSGLKLIPIVWSPWDSIAPSRRD